LPVDERLGYALPALPLHLRVKAAPA
jgi:hypothetical protein